METAVANLNEERTLGLRGKLGAYVELTKPRIAFMLLLTSAAGFYLGSWTPLNWVLFLNAMIGIALLAFGVATLNQWMERRTDVLMDRTSSRPIPTGRVTANEALVFGLGQVAASLVYLYVLVNPLTAALAVVVVVGYLLVYTPLKTRTSASTAIGAVPGAIPPLIGYTAAANEVTLGAWSLFVILFLWQFPHFLAIAWMYKEDYAKAGIWMLPVVDKDGSLTARQIVMFAFMLLPASLAPFFFGMAGVVYLVGATLLGTWFLVESISTARAKTKERARRLLLVSVIYLPLLFGLMISGY
ncbi:MAG: protoheme IX farnesyltransferase [Blastocatellia bacterium]|nr:protoheme IX farnesyltransferase [Blastocatellia bacterium]